ncbi:DUF3990 domain-containing protein [uncultured Adlercreutzia sp.]|uniref:DUF3990 domain-containing protein n=1 Tax=uncultured Adlercreutzia sp. TaxID=875803 RepID=UPI0025D8231E|nr:DUF3990 domain-containing protein [uncultured Adlercreutzia sp.]
MILYHGSNVAVEQPRILVSNRSVDFGAGFYTTSSYQQAERWATLQAERRKEGLPVVSVYELSDDALTRLSILQFADADGDWLDFVVANRKQIYTGPLYDLVIGPVANDRTMRVVNDYMNDVIDKSTALVLLEPQRLTDQYCFRTTKALGHLTCTEVNRLG